MTKKDMYRVKELTNKIKQDYSMDIGLAYGGKRLNKAELIEESIKEINSIIDKYIYKMKPL